MICKSPRHRTSSTVARGCHCPRQDTLAKRRAHVGCAAAPSDDEPARTATPAPPNLTLGARRKELGAGLTPPPPRRRPAGVPPPEGAGLRSADGGPATPKCPARADEGSKAAGRAGRGRRTAARSLGDIGKRSGRSRRRCRAKAADLAARLPRSRSRSRSWGRRGERCRSSVRARCIPRSRRSRSSG